MAIDYTLPLRAIQVLFAVIVLGTTGYVAHIYNILFNPPSQVSFLIFTAVWTFLAVLFLTLVPLFMRSLAHPFALLGVEALTMLFWFAGFIALAVFVQDHFVVCSGSVCGSLTAAIIFGAFEWALFLATTIMIALGTFRSGTYGTSKPVTGTGPTVTV